MLSKIIMKNSDFYIGHKPLEYLESGNAFAYEKGIYILSYNTFGEIDLSGEIQGDTRLLESISLISGKVSGTIFCGVTTAIMGLKHISVAVCHKGRLIDIVDRTSNIFADDFETGDKIKVFSTDNCKIALLIDKDVLIEKNWEKVLPHCDLVLGIINASSEAVINGGMKLGIKYNKPYIMVDNFSVNWKD